MPAYNFQERFAPDVESGVKGQTVRPKRKRPTKAGDILYLYTGMRTKKCRKLKEARCLLVTDIEIDVGGIDWKGQMMMVGSPNADDFARADGFSDSEEMIWFFEDTYELPFRGEVIQW